MQGKFENQNTKPEKPEYYNYKSEHQNQLTPEQEEYERLRKLIVLVCEESISTFDKQILKLTDTLTKYYVEKQSESKDSILKLLTDSITHISRKSIVYAVTVALLHQKIPTFVDELIDKLTQRLQQMINEGELTCSKNILIFIGELVNIGIINSIPFVTILYDILREAQSNPNNDYYTDIMVSIIPYVASGLKERAEMQFNGFLQNLETLMNKRSDDYYNLLQPFSDKKYTDFLQNYWEVIKKEVAQNEWSEQDYLTGAFIRKKFATQLAGVKQIQKQPKFVSMPTTSDIAASNRQFKSPLFIPIFDQGNQYFEDEFLTSLDRMLHHENILQILISFGTNKRLLGEQLMKYLSFFQKADKSQENLEVVIFETIIGQLFNLPRPRFSIALLSTLLEFMRHNEGEQIDNYLIKVFESLFPRIDLAEIEVVENVTNLFSHYLNNINVKWDWTSLTKLVGKIQDEKDSTNLKVFFLESLFTKLSMLVSLPKLKETIPQKFHQYLLPEDNEQIYVENWTQVPGAEAIRELLKQKEEKIGEQVLQTLKNPEENGIKFNVRESRKVFIETFLLLSSKVYSHVQVLFNRFKVVFESLKNQDEFTNDLISIILDFWKNQPSHQYLLINQFYKEKILSINQISEELIKRCLDQETNNQTFNILSSLLYKFIQIMVEHDFILLQEEQNFGNRDDTITNAKVDVEESQINLTESSANIFTTLAEIAPQYCKQSAGVSRDRFLSILRVYGRLCHSYVAELWENINRQFEIPDEDKDLIFILKNIEQSIQSQNQKTV